MLSGGLENRAESDPHTALGPSHCSSSWLGVGPLHSPEVKRARGALRGEGPEPPLNFQMSLRTAREVDGVRPSPEARGQATARGEGRGGLGHGQTTRVGRTGETKRPATSEGHGGKGESETLGHFGRVKRG